MQNGVLYCTFLTNTKKRKRKNLLNHFWGHPKRSATQGASVGVVRGWRTMPRISVKRDLIEE
jgi:hypothetical protein